MRALKRTLLGLACLCAVAAIAPPAAAQGVYGALAISTTTGAFGYGYNYANEAQARDRAMSECRKHAQDCRVYATFQRQCISIARAANNAFGWALGYPEDERPERALNSCASQNGDACKIVTQFCSGVAGR